MKRTYVLPAVHLMACLTLPLGHLVPSLSYIAIVWTFVMVADLPISLVSYFLAWRYSLLSAIWIFVAGTACWYFLSQQLLKFRRRDETDD
jgi:hypothetical protein